MCRVLSVSVGGFYAWRKRPASAREQEDGTITEQIVNIYRQHQGRYGSPRIHAQLRDEGIHVGRKRVVRLMKQAQLAAHHTTHRVMTTRADPAAVPAENVLDRAFLAQRPNEKWVADITYIPTGSSRMYLAVVLDLFSRRVVGWAMNHRQDEVLVEQAVTMAVTHRKPAAGLLHHSDRGCQYTSQAYQALLKGLDFQISMSRKGNCWDNAVMERFFGTLKRECTSRAHFVTHEETRLAIFEYIEVYYNRVRKHSTLGYLSPMQFEIMKN
ncbi:transposase [Dictyobacter sp. S3.2.2.5]|uniref:Transposase n=2 Tax=Dictyobacter halimunensis TaxID=3026934 RepID=A0ABQ6FP11_9CHLR|nr:transposase [Dictyobacter sp. S3.2.2.5]GLV54489.1 transposase [Dictyobacter sp. S3.2.2.5]GLV56011.1 transposase [Dictyobacter sp. S3.2.2.5]